MHYKIILAAALWILLVSSAAAQILPPPPPPPEYYAYVTPTNPAARIGSNVTFTAYGKLGYLSPSNYQWFFRDVEIPGATNQSLTLENVQLTNSGAYKARMWRSTLVTTSTPSILTVFGSIIQWQHTNGPLAGWLMNGTNFLRASTLANAPSVAAGWRISGFADINGDGQKDFLWQDQQGRVVAWIVDQNTYVTNSTVQGTGVAAQWRLFGSGDLNGDGREDILWQHTDGRLAAWLRQETNFTSMLLRNGNPAGAGWKAVGVGDFDGDGKNDILFHHTTRRQAVWFMDGTNFVSASIIRNGQQSAIGWNIVGLSDFNEDTRIDILWQSPENRLAVWLMNQTNVTKVVPLRNGQTAGAGWRVIGIR